MRFANASAPMRPAILRFQSVTPILGPRERWRKRVERLRQPAVRGVERHTGTIVPPPDFGYGQAITYNDRIGLEPPLEDSRVDQRCNVLAIGADRSGDSLSAEEKIDLAAVNVDQVRSF